MKKFALLQMLSVNCATAFCQSISQLDSLLTIPGLYMIGYPDDGPKEALKGLKPLFCKDKEVIKSFFNELKLSSDTGCTGNAYYNYILHFSSDSLTLDTWVGLSFNNHFKNDKPTLNSGNDVYYSFNPKSLSYLKSHAEPIQKALYTTATLQQSRDFYNYLKCTPETYFISSIFYDSTYIKYTGSVLLEFEFPDTLSYENGEKFIRNKIQEITVSSDYFYHMKSAHWRKEGFQTESIVLHIAKEHLLKTSQAYTIKQWEAYGPISFRVYSMNKKKIQAYYLNLMK